MGRNPCCTKEGLNRGAWTVLEDQILTDFIKAHGEGKWRNLPKKAGLNRCGKSCRLRWLNYLRPDIKRGNISADEEELIVRLHKLLGNRWALIAGRLPGRTDNEIKNYWNTNLCKKVHQQIINTTPQNLPEATKLTDDVVELGSSSSPNKVVSVAVAVAEESNNCDTDVNNLYCSGDFMMDFDAEEMSFLSGLLNSDQPLVLFDDITMQQHDWTLNTYGQ